MCWIELPEELWKCNNDGPSLKFFLFQNVFHYKFSARYIQELLLSEETLQ